MTRLSGVVVLLCSDVARAAGLRPESSTDSPLPGSSVPPESPYPSFYADAHAFGRSMGGAAGSSYAGSPSDTETGTEDSVPYLHDAPQSDVKRVEDLKAFGWSNFLVLRPAFTGGGETHALQALSKETVQQLRDRLADEYPLECFGDSSIHVDFRRVANDAASEAVASGDVDLSGVAAGFLSGDERVVWGSADRTTVLQYSKTPAAPPDEEPHAEQTENTDARGQVVVKGLEEWLHEVREKFHVFVNLTAANTWLHERGAVDYTAIFDQLPAFCDAVGLKRLERDE